MKGKVIAPVAIVPKKARLVFMIDCLNPNLLKDFDSTIILS